MRLAYIYRKLANASASELLDNPAIAAVIPVFLCGHGGQSDVLSPLDFLSIRYVVCSSRVAGSEGNTGCYGAGA